MSSVSSRCALFAPVSMHVSPSVRERNTLVLETSEVRTVRIDSAPRILEGEVIRTVKFVHQECEHFAFERSVRSVYLTRNVNIIWEPCFRYHAIAFLAASIMRVCHLPHRHRGPCRLSLRFDRTRPHVLFSLKCGTGALSRYFSTGTITLGRTNYRKEEHILDSCILVQLKQLFELLDKCWASGWSRDIYTCLRTIDGWCYNKIVSIS